MNETRRLDVLAIVGGILGIAMVVYLLYQRGSGCPDLTKWRSQSDLRKVRAAVLRQLPESETKADLAVQLGVRTAAGQYANSPRVQFRLGTKWNDDKALRRAAELDPNNALPLYFLASRTDSMDGRLALFREASRRDSFTDYPFSFRGRLEPMAFDINTAKGFESLNVCGRMGKTLSEHALRLHEQGRTDEALEVLKLVEVMGWKLAKRENPTLLSLMVGVSVVRVAEKSEKEICTEIGLKSGLDRIEREQVRLDYLSTGARYIVSHANERLVKGVNRRMAIFLPVVCLAVAQLLILLVSGIWWQILLLRSRKQPGSELHLEATKALSAGRLAKWYTIASMGAIGLLLGLNSLLSYSNSSAACAAMYLVALAFPLNILVNANMCYRRAFPQTSWRKAPIADKREFQRRMLGVQGGAMVFLVILGLLIAGGTKAATGAYPWDVQSYISKLRREEPKFVQQLLAGKIKLPANAER